MILKAHLEKINRTSLPEIFLFLLVFFLPIQERYHKWLKPFSRFAFEGKTLPSYFLETRFEFYITDLLMLGFLATLLYANRCSFWEGPRKFFVLFLGVALASLMLSPGRADIWPYFRFAQMLLPILTMLSIFSMRHAKSVMRTCFWILLFASLFQCFVSFYQYAFQMSVGLKHFGEPFLGSIEAPRIAIGNGEILRSQGTLTHPNILGGFLGLAIFASSFLMMEKRGTLRVLIGASIVLQIFALYLTFSRGALFGLWSGFVLCNLLFWRRGALALLIPFILGGALSFGILHEPLLHRTGAIYEEGLATESISSRMTFHKEAIELGKQRPLLGHGWGRYLNEVEPLGSTTQTVHNIYLLILAETGVLGFLSLAIGVGALLFSAWRNGLGNEQRALLVILLFLFWFGCVDHFLVLRAQGRLMLCVTLGLFGALCRASPLENQSRSG